jgi:hypothetical protein
MYELSVVARGFWWEKAFSVSENVVSGKPARLYAFDCCPNVNDARLRIAVLGRIG